MFLILSIDELTSHMPCLVSMRSNIQDKNYQKYTHQQAHNYPKFYN